MLFTGDVEGKGEEYLAERLSGNIYDVLKVAHHGSGNSTGEKFLENVTVHVALISAGKNNLYGHPHRETLERLVASECRIYNTQEDGAVMIRTDGCKMWIDTVLNGK